MSSHQYQYSHGHKCFWQLVLTFGFMGMQTASSSMEAITAGLSLNCDVSLKKLWSTTPIAVDLSVTLVADMGTTATRLSFLFLAMSFSFDPPDLLKALQATPMDTRRNSEAPIIITEMDQEGSPVSSSEIGALVGAPEGTAVDRAVKEDSLSEAAKSDTPTAVNPPPFLLASSLFMTLVIAVDSIVFFSVLDNVLKALSLVNFSFSIIKFRLNFTITPSLVNCLLLDAIMSVTSMIFTFFSEKVPLEAAATPERNAS